MKIHILGDSISMHYGPYLEQYVKGVIEYSRKEGEQDTAISLDRPSGANGGDSKMVLTYLNSCLQNNVIDADYILINCGLHDIKTNIETHEKMVPLHDYENNLKEIIKVVKLLGFKMIWIRTTPCDEKVHNHSEMPFHRFSADCVTYNHAADKIMNTFSVPIIDLHTYTENLLPDIYDDHVHFKESIREKQALFIADWLMSHLKLKPKKI